MHSQSAKLHLKVRLKIEQIARLRADGVKDASILRILGITQSGLSRIIRLDEYKEIEEAVVQGKLTKMDELLANRTKTMQDFYAPAVPAAMRTLVEAVLNKKASLTDRMRAASEILDRDPRRAFVKNAARGGDAINGDASQLPADILASRTADANAIQQKLASPTAASANASVSGSPASVPATQVPATDAGETIH